MKTVEVSETKTTTVDECANGEDSANSLLKCNPYLVLSYNVMKKTPDGLKERFYRRVLLKNKTDLRSQSLPNCLQNEDEDNPEKPSEDVCDDSNAEQLCANNQVPLWFKTWPEKRGVNDTVAASPVKVSNGFNNNKLSFNEALQNISLAYSPVTKQLHFVDEPSKETEEVAAKKGHRRNEAGSFSSTISSLSDPSSSGSLLDTDDQQAAQNEQDKCAKRALSGFFFNKKNVFSWKFFAKPAVVDANQNSPQHEQVVASSSALIQHNRPSNLPAKTVEEESRHRQEYEAMLLAAKRKEVQTNAAKQKQQKLQLRLEEQQASAAKYFMLNVLPKWDAMFNGKKTRELWWQGLPSSVRGKVWRLAIGNELNLTRQLYEICSSRAQTRLNSPDLTSHHSGSEIDQEGSMDVIQLDIARTFPHLGIFQEGGPYSEMLHALLAAYVCYRPDVGYVQGMSYIAAVLILNMDQYDAFVCFANLLNRPLHVAAFTLNQAQMRAYYEAYNQVLERNLPRLHSHFLAAGLTPDLYLLDWIYTVFAKAMPLDVACRVWDLFLRDGDEFIFRTAIGILHLNQEALLTMDFLHGAQFLTRLPDDLCTDQLFKSIQYVSTNVGKVAFNALVEKCKANALQEDTQ